MFNRLNKNIFLLNLALILLIIGFGLHYVNFYTKANLSGAQQIEDKLDQFRNDFSNIYNSIISNDTLNADEILEQHHQAYFTLLFYKNDTLQHWSNNDVVLAPGKMKKLTNAEKTIKLRKGYYNVIKRQHETKNSKQTLIGLLPIYFQHEIENKYIQNKFNNVFELEGNYKFHPRQNSRFSSKFKHISNQQGIYLFSISSNIEQLKKYSIYSILCFALGLITLLIYLTSIAFYFLKQNKQLFGFGVVLFGIVLISFIIFLLHYIPGFDELQFFNPTVYASSKFFGSIGDLFLHLVLITWLFAFINHNLKVETFIKLSYNKKIILFFSIHFVLVVIALYISGLIKSLVIDSTINFDVRTLFQADNFFNLVIALICIMLMLGTFYFLYQAIVRISKVLRLSLTHRFALVLAAVSLGFIIEYTIIYLSDNLVQSKSYNNPAYSIGIFDIKHVFAFILILGTYVFQISERGSFRRNLSLNFTFLWLSFSCLFAASYIFSLDSKKEKVNRKLVAQQLSQGNDPQTEAYLSNKIELIKKDRYFAEYIQNRVISKKTFDNKVIKRYFQDYISSFEISIYMYNKTGDYHIRSAGKSRNDILEKKLTIGKKTFNQNLWRYVNRANQYEYLIETKVKDTKENDIGILCIEIVPTDIEKVLVYRELLQSKNIANRGVKISDEYSYAVYKKDQFEKEAISSAIQKGSFNFPVNFKPYFGLSDDVSEITFFDKDGFSHLIYAMMPNEEYLVLTKESFNWLGAISLFSFVYLMAIVLLGLVWLIYLSIKAVMYNSNPFLFLFSSFRRRVNLSMLALLLFSFFLTGIIITVFLFRQIDTANTSRLRTKKDAVQLSFKNEIVEQRIKESNFYVQVDTNFIKALQRTRSSVLVQKEELKTEQNKKTQKMTITLDSLSSSISKIHGADINIYNPSGNLIGSSLRTVFDKELLTDKLNPSVITRLIKEQKKDYQQKEKIGELEYTSAYFQLKDNIDDKLLAIVNIPYYLSNDRTLEKEATDFILALVNVYVFLFILGSLIALLLSKTLTISLTKVGDKMQTFRLGQKHDPIKWDYDDEIGKLINGYNQMMQELDDSAKALAYTERQSAWRQMARQVAHEIKNPLTPMKLSIQHLQRALNDDSPNVKELTIKVSKTLVEQIENLSNIASVFSEFAKMPQAENAVLNINELIENVLPLFDTVAYDVKINYEKPVEDWMVYSDKNRLVQVFNNLIKNAIQSIPKDREGVINVFSYRENGKVHISLQDNGSGIPHDIRSKVFTPNFTTKGSGSGLGLAISKQIIEQSDGKITFETALGEGTTFHIELPTHR